MSAADRFYITTPIYYVNDSPHIGHAYTTLACDAVARFMRLDGRRVMFLTGTDEHGQKVEKAARDAGTRPAEPSPTGCRSRFRDLAGRWTSATTTSSARPSRATTRAVTALWEKLVASGDIYLGNYAGWYSVRDEAFYAESELVEGKAPTGAPVEWVEEPSYFFRLSAWRDRLLAFYDANPDCILPLTRRNEVVSFVKGGLQDLSVSRTSFRWGIPVPGDPGACDVCLARRADQLHVGASAIPIWTARAFRSFWPADIHVGRQGHPALPRGLLAGVPDGGRHRAGEAGVRPWLVDQRGPEDLEVAGQRHRSAGAARALWAAMRPAISCCARSPSAPTAISAMPRMLRRANADLANDYGNLAQRVLSMIARTASGRVPEPGAARRSRPGPARRGRWLVAEIARRRWRSRRRTARWSSSGRSSAMPTAGSTGRRPGACARPIRPGCARCCGCWPRPSAASPSLPSRSCPTRRRSCWTSWR